VRDPIRFVPKKKPAAGGNPRVGGGGAGAFQRAARLEDAGGRAGGRGCVKAARPAGWAGSRRGNPRVGGGGSAASPLVAATTSPRAHPIPASGAVVRQPGARRAPPGRCAVTRAVAASFSLGLFSNLK
jgi:hypothetical protein